MIEAAAVAGLVGNNCSPPANEAQARELARLPAAPVTGGSGPNLEVLLSCFFIRETKDEIALAFKRLRALPKSEGGAKRKMGRPKKGEEKSGSRSTHSKSRDDAAAILGVGPQEARALETIFTTPGVPEELKAAVNKGTVAPTPAAKAVRAESKRMQAEKVSIFAHLRARRKTGLRSQ
jgi:hypothetical protein